MLAAYDWDLSKLADQQQLQTFYQPCHQKRPYTATGCWMGSFMLTMTMALMEGTRPAGMGSW